MVGVDLWLNAPLLPHMLCGRALQRWDSIFYLLLLPLFQKRRIEESERERERDVCNKKWGPSVTLVSLQLRETSCAAHSASQRRAYFHTLATVIIMLWELYINIPQRAHTLCVAQMRIERCARGGIALDVGITRRPRNFDCEGFKIIALAFEKLSLPRRKIEREVQIAQRGCKLPQSEKVLAGCWNEN